MANTEQNLKRWGNSLGVRLPAEIAKAAQLRADQRVELTVEDGAVIIRALNNAPMSLADRLLRFDPIQHGGEAMATDTNLGAEKW